MVFPRRVLGGGACKGTALHPFQWAAGGERSCPALVRRRREPGAPRAQPGSRSAAGLLSEQTLPSFEPTRPGPGGELLSPRAAPARRVPTLCPFPSLVSLLWSGRAGALGLSPRPQNFLNELGGRQGQDSDGPQDPTPRSQAPPRRPYRDVSARGPRLSPPRASRARPLPGCLCCGRRQGVWGRGSLVRCKLRCASPRRERESVEGAQRTATKCPRCS